MVLRPALRDRPIWRGCSDSMRIFLLGRWRANGIFLWFRELLLIALRSFVWFTVSKAFEEPMAITTMRKGGFSLFIDLFMSKEKPLDILCPFYLRKARKIKKKKQ